MSIDNRNKDSSGCINYNLGHDRDSERGQMYLVSVWKMKGFNFYLHFNLMSFILDIELA